MQNFQNPRHHQNPSAQRQRPQAQHQRNAPHASPSPSPDLRTRRDWLWRKRLELELEMHDLLAQEQQTLADVQLLQHRKDDIRRQRPQIIAQIVLTSLVRLPAPHERAYHYLLERLIQEEAAALHHLNWCRSRYVGLSGQIATIDTEIALLLTHP